MKFIDLYSGIGGFRYALEELGHECVFSAEKDKDAVDTYFKNFPSHNPFFDMDIIPNLSNKEIDELIPNHEILTAGFPCQPFSIGGNKKGFNEARGTQFFNILRILEVKKPKFIILENVKHIVRHDSGKTFKIIKQELKKLNYDIGEIPLILSPESLGIPHRRDRSFMIAAYKSKPFKVDIPPKVKFENSIEKIFDFGNYEKKFELDKQSDWIINAWEELMNKLNSKPPIIWLDQMLSDEWNDEWQIWKKNYVKKMRIYYKENKEVFDSWIKSTNIMSISNVKYRKFEWLSGESLNSNFSIKNKIITIRQSGIRISKPNVFPTLVASVETPITYDYVSKKFRWMTLSEVCKLQSFPEKFIPNLNTHKAYKMFGNAVNVEVVKFIAKEMKL